MNVPFFIAKRLALSSAKTFSSTILRIGTAAIALSMSVMLIATALVTGFQNGISDKIFGFWGHIHITHFNSNQALEAVPIAREQAFYPSLDTVKQVSFLGEKRFFGFPIGEAELRTRGGIRHIQTFANKAGIIKTGDQLEGIVLKGVGDDYDWAFVQNYLLAGKVLNLRDTFPSKDILVSQSTANRLRLQVGDAFTVHFVEGSVQVIRQFSVCGIYKTGLEEYDKKFALVDIRQVQRLNGWKPNQVGGFEVFIDHIADLDPLGDYVYYNALQNQQLYASTIKEVYPNLFGWLELQDMNGLVVVLLMTLVAVVNMATALLILILERTNMVGVLKALGSTNWHIRQIFLYQAAHILLAGLFWGNLIGLTLGYLHLRFELIKLPEESYYFSVAPLEFSLPNILFLNSLTLVVTLLVLLIPSYLVTRISPVRAVRFK